MEMGKKYLIALPVNDELLDNLNIQELKGKVDVFELRVDQFRRRETSYVKEIVELLKKEKFYTILTIRSKEEGGTDIPDGERFTLFRELIEYIDIVDIELTSYGLRKEVIKLAEEKGKLSLVSYHDFEKTPSESEIQKIIDEGKNLGANIVKYAFSVKSKDDVGRILKVTYKNRDKNLVAIGMGELGKITRVAGFFFGSIMTYTFVGKSFAPGQIELNRLIEELKFYGIRS